MRSIIGPLAGVALLAALTPPAAADVPAARLVRAMPGAPGFVEADGRMPILVELPPGVTGSDVGLFELRPGFAAARLTPDEVIGLDEAFPGLRVLTGPPKQPLMDKVGVYTRAAEYRAQSGSTGKGVVVGIVDTGVDVTHPAFIDPETKKSRIAWLLAPGFPRGVHADVEARFGCDRYDLGTCAVWSGPELDELIASGEIPEELRDYSGHGTHVTGIAAGNGRSSSRLSPRTDFVGMAPEATIVVAAPGGGGGFSDPNILRGTSFLFDRGDAMGQPVVANLSLGGDFGPHDGTSVLEKSLAALVGDDHPGRAIVISAGNSGGLNEIDGDSTGIHTEARVRPSSSVRVPFKVAAPSGGGVFIWVTMRAGDEVSVGLEGLDGETWVDPVEVGDEAGYEGDDGTQVGVINNVVDTRSDLTEDTNGAVIAIQGTFGETGEEMAVTLEGSGDAQLWIAPSGFSVGVFRRALVEGTVAVPATHPRMLAVGSSISRVEWKAIDGNTLSAGAVDASDLDGISDFSGCGPTAVGVPKPEIVAPGQFVASAMSADADPALYASGIFSAACPADSASCLVVHPNYALSAGTSMSSPVVAGAIALLLARDPNLTQARITDVLQEGARRHGGPVANYVQAGPGALDVMGAMAALAGEDPAAGTPPDVAASFWNLSATYARPDPTWPIEGVIQLRRSGGELASGLDGSLLALEVDNGIVQKAISKLGHGTFRFTVAGRRGTEGTDMRVRVLYDGLQIGEELTLPVGSDAFAAAEPPSAVGGCSVASAAGPGAFPGAGAGEAGAAGAVVAACALLSRRRRRRVAPRDAARAARR